MILERGDIWQVFGSTGLFLFTSNRVVRKDGLAVMGRGVDKEMAERYPEVRAWMGGTLASGVGYNVSMLGKVEREAPYVRQTVGYFMTRDHYMGSSTPSIIERSVDHLIEHIDRFKLGRVDMNFPGINNGQLKREDVLPLIERLPDNVHVWEYA